jgi:NAD(P)-dependent dehydrogenase (short-subunit alcohol dehydrogenase family)
VAELGRLDIILAQAAIAPMSFKQRSDEEDVATWREVLDVNLTGAWIACRAGIPHIQAGGRGGAIVMTSSTSGLKGFAGYAGAGGGYTAAKAGMIGLMRSMANALAAESIRVNCVVPTAVNTMMATNEQMTQWIGDDPSKAKHMANPMPVGMVEPEDISKAIVYLVSDDGRYVTGTALPVDAGFVNK